MLQTALAKRAQGTDVIVGLVAARNRPETQALLEGLEVLPARRVVRGALKSFTMALAHAYASELEAFDHTQSAIPSYRRR